MAAVQSAPVPAHELSFEPKQLPKLRSNHGKVVDAASIGWMKSIPADTPLEEIRRLYDEDGYIFVKGLLPREDVLDMREHYFSFMSSTGILKPGTTPRQGIFNAELDPRDCIGIGAAVPPPDRYMQQLIDAHVTDHYLKFLEHPALRGFIREFMGWKKDIILKRTMLRHAVPGGLSTGIHYDKIFLRGGQADFLTAWVPIGDIPASGGGLLYLENSSPLGRAVEADFIARAVDLPDEERINAFNAHMNSAGTISDDAEEYARTEARGRRWLIADYEAGAVVFHDPYMIHGAAKNEDPKGSIRLSCDLRFYEEGAALDNRWMKVWTPNDGL